ncbi:MAG: hypothetical protein IT299_12545 [Dehalococcoidia bacterium]|nr:hypothetical protein [Dehalococcoidia bacterium]
MRLVVVVGVALAMLVLVQTQRVAAAVPLRLLGMTSDLAVLEIRTDGATLQEFLLSEPLYGVPGLCNGSTIGMSVPIRDGGFYGVGPKQSLTTGAITNVVFHGTIDANGFALGNTEASPASGNPCVRHNVPFAAVPDPGSAPAAVNASFSGTTDKGDAVSFRVTANGTVTDLSVKLPGGCPLIAGAPGVEFPLTDNAVNIGSPAAGGFLRLFVSGTQAYGTFASATPPPQGCFTVIGTFSARGVVAPTGPQSTTPIPPAGGVVGPIPPAGGAGLLVSGEASSAPGLVTHLRARGCVVASLAVLRGGTWSVYVNGAPAIVNSAFPSLLDASTPFYLRCE